MQSEVLWLKLIGASLSFLDNDCGLYVTEHVKLRGGRKSATPDYSKLLNDTIYVHRILGNIMFNGKLIQASTNFGCFMTLSNGSAVGSQIPESFKVWKHKFNKIKRKI